MREIGRSIEPFKHGTLVLVAVAYTALALSNGGSSQRLTAAATIAVWLAVAVGPRHGPGRCGRCHGPPSLRADALPAWAS